MERPVAHAVPTGNGMLTACVECWPELLDLLESMGGVLTDCVGPCCS